MRLEPVTPDYYPFLYELSTDPALSYHWVHRGLPPVYESFVAEIRSGYLAHFIIVRAADDRPVGAAMAYGEDFRHGHCQLAVALASAATSKGMGVEAGSLLLDYVMTTWPFRSVYLQSPGFSVTAIASGQNSHFDPVALLRAHRYHEGRYWDEHIMAVSRERWEHSKLRHRISPAAVAPGERDLLQSQSAIQSSNGQR